MKKRTKRLATKIQSPQDLARERGVSAVTIRDWCERGLVVGATVMGRAWLIPKPATVLDSPKIGRPKKED